MNHGVYTTEQATSVATPAVAASGIPIVFGTAPVQMAENPAPLGKPVLATSFKEARKLLGYSDDWKSYTLCEMMDAHFRLFAMSPVIFVNVLDPATHKTSVEAAELPVANRRVELPGEAINDKALVVKATGGDPTYVKGEDYETFYAEGKLVIELTADGKGNAAENINVAYDKVNPTAVTASSITGVIDAVDLCAARLGVAPDLLLAPGWSHEAEVSAMLAAKAEKVGGLLSAKALIDLNADGSSGAKDCAAAIEAKNKASTSDASIILCWPMGKLGGKLYHLSTLVAGLMAQVDASNGGCPMESPSNKRLPIDGICLSDLAEVDMTLSNANLLNAAGIVTALNMGGGWTAWGNYTSCYPAVNDVKDYFIPVSRTFGWIRNTIIRTFWGTVDKPMTRRLVDTVVDSCNIWLNGLSGSGKLLGARVAMLADENPLADLMAGKVTLHVYATPPSPAQEIDFVVEYDASYVTAAFGG